MGRDKDGIGNRGLKELIWTTHGHELMVGRMLEGWGTGRRGYKGRKNWENCNSIITKKYFKKFYLGG